MIHYACQAMLCNATVAVLYIPTVCTVTPGETRDSLNGVLEGKSFNRSYGNGGSHNLLVELAHLIHQFTGLKINGPVE